MKFRGFVQGLESVADDVLLRLFAESRNEDLFTELFRRHGRKVFGSCFAFLEDSGRAEDVTQETFLQAYRSIDSFTGGDALAWLLTIARNRCIDRWRSRRPEVPYEDSPVECAIASNNHTIGTSVHLALLQLERELPTLPVHQRECLRLKAEGYSYEETASQIGCSAEEVRSHLQNGRRTLRLRMGAVLSEIL